MNRSLILFFNRAKRINLILTTFLFCLSFSSHLLSKESIPSNDTEHRIAKLEQSITVLKDELDKIKQDKVENNVSTNGGVIIINKGKNTKVQIGGRIQADYAFYNNDKQQLGSGSELRRARLYIKGNFDLSWKYKLQIDYGGGASNATVKDAYIGYTAFNNASLLIGNIFEMPSLESYTSSKYITFMERSLPIAAFAPDRAMGISYTKWSDSWFYGLGVFGDNANTEKALKDEGYGISGRFTYVPKDKEGDVLEFGLSGAWRSTADAKLVSFKARPDSHVTDVSLVNTGTIENADSHQLLVLESSMVKQSFSLQAEYFNKTVSRSLGSNLSFNGWYTSASYFLTGESRPYSISGASYGKVRPNDSQSGAWEIALRLSSLNLNDDDIFGGKMDSISFALNWYPNANIRLMINLIKTNTKVLNIEDNPTTLQFRLQTIF